MSKKLLIVDDDATIVQLLSLSMEQRNEDVAILSADTGEDAIRTLQFHAPDLIVLDLRMTKGDGFSILEHLKAQKSAVPVVVLTNYRNDEYVERCTHFGVKEYLVKHENRIDRIIEKLSSHLG